MSEVQNKCKDEVTIVFFISMLGSAWISWPKFDGEFEHGFASIGPGRFCELRAWTNLTANSDPT